MGSPQAPRDSISEINGQINRLAVGIQNGEIKGEKISVEQKWQMRLPYLRQNFEIK